VISSPLLWKPQYLSSGAIVAQLYRLGIPASRITLRTYEFIDHFDGSDFIVDFDAGDGFPLRCYYPMIPTFDAGCSVGEHSVDCRMRVGVKWNLGSRGCREPEIGFAYRFREVDALAELMQKIGRLPALRSNQSLSDSSDESAGLAGETTGQSEVMSFPRSKDLPLLQMNGVTMKVSVSIKDKDRMVGAMVKALAVEVAGFQAVKGTTKDFLETNGFYEFTFPSLGSGNAFRSAVAKYIGHDLAEVRA
jgi:hypothetical protein